MSQYRAPVRDQRFVLHEVLNIAQYSDLPGFADADTDTVDAILEEGAKFAEGVLAPISKVGDVEGSPFDLLQELSQIIVVEWKGTNQESVQDHATGPNVGPPAVIPLALNKIKTLATTKTKDLPSFFSRFLTLMTSGHA